MGGVYKARYVMIQSDTVTKYKSKMKFKKSLKYT